MTRTIPGPGDDTDTGAYCAPTDGLGASTLAGRANARVCRRIRRADRSVRARGGRLAGPNHRRPSAVRRQLRLVAGRIGFVFTRQRRQVLDLRGTWRVAPALDAARGPPPNAAVLTRRTPRQLSSAIGATKSTWSWSSVDGTWQRVLNRGTDFPMDPSWSPDGTRVVWHAYPNNLMPWDQSALVVADIDGRRTADDRAARRGRPMPMPASRRTGSRIVCVCDRAGALNVTEISARRRRPADPPRGPMGARRTRLFARRTDDRLYPQRRRRLHALDRGERRRDGRVR